MSTKNAQRPDRRVMITGLGVVSSIGIGKDSFWESMLKGRSGIRKITSFDASSYPTQVAGEICEFDPVAFLPHKTARRMDRSCQMVLAALQLALEDGDLCLGREKPSRIGVFTGTAVGGQAWAFREYEIFREKGLHRINPFTAISTFPNASSAEVSRKLGILGPSVTISSGCVSSTLALGYAVDNIRLGRIDVAFVGGTEAPLEPGIFGAYCAARVMTSEIDMPSRVPRPFDLHRDGIVLSEGAGMLVCESLEHAMERGAKIYAEVVGWSHNSDSSSMMMINPDGCQGQKLILDAIAEASLGIEDIDSIQAHAAGTRMDDKTEANVFHAIFGNRIDRIPVTSPKSMLGHTQGACGAIESIVAALSISHGIVPQTINCTELDPECSIPVVREKPLIRPVACLLMNTFGFGGKNVCIIFRRLIDRG